MKRFVSVLIAVIAAMAFMAMPASAASLGISPSHIEVEVPTGGSTPVNFQVHYFSGDLKVSLVDIPLEVEPAVFHIASSPTDIVVTISDNTFDPQEYNGYVRFLSTGNATVGLAVNIVARVTVELSVNTVERPSRAPIGGGGIERYYIETDLFGVAKSYLISYSGKLEKKIESTSEDGMLTLTIPRRAIALDKDGKRLKTLEVAVDESPPEPPENAHIIGLAYDFGPDGATFDPPITFTWRYNPDILPEGVAEEDLVLGYYDEEAGKWVELDCVVDTENNTITASVPHFTTFAIIGAITPPPAPTPPTPAPAPTPPAPAPPAPAPAPTPPAPAPAPAPPPVPAPAPAPAAPPPPAIPPAPPGINWPVVGGIIGGVIVVALLIFFLVRRRAA